MVDAGVPGIVESVPREKVPLYLRFVETQCDRRCSTSGVIDVVNYIIEYPRGIAHDQHAVSSAECDRAVSKHVVTAHQNNSGGRTPCSIRENRLDPRKHRVRAAAVQQGIMRHVLDV